MHFLTTRISFALLCTAFAAACGATPVDDAGDVGTAESELTTWASVASTCGCTAFSGTIKATVLVPAGADLQAAINSAPSGAELVLDAGATYYGNFTLPVRTSGYYVTIRSSAPVNPCTRVTPADAPSLARIYSKNGQPVFSAAAGAHHFRLVNLEIASPGYYNETLVQIGTGAETSTAQLPHDFILDRVYVHGDARLGGKRGVSLNGTTIRVQNSWISDIKSTNQDSQALAGWNGTGGWTIANNYLEASGENMLVGGADPKISGLVPTNIKVKFNTFTKQLSWRPGDASYAGTHWLVKNIFELKNARQVTVEGNLFEHNWPDAQKGFAILFTVRNQDGTAPWSQVADVTFRRNIVRQVAAAVNILGHDDIQSSQLTQNILVENNLFTDVGGAWGSGSSVNGRLFQLVSGTNEPGPANVTINHNTGMASGGYYLLGVGGTTLTSKPGFVFTNQLVSHESGVYGDNLGTTAALAGNFPGAVFTANGLIGGNASLYTSWPGNFFPAADTSVGFAAGGEYELASASVYNNVGTDGKDLGASYYYLDAATQCH